MLTRNEPDCNEGTSFQDSGKVIPTPMRCSSCDVIEPSNDPFDMKKIANTIETLEDIETKKETVANKKASEQAANDKEEDQADKDDNDDDDDETVIMRSQQVRKHGFTRPFAIQQVVSWVMFLFFLVSFILTTVTVWDLERQINSQVIPFLSTCYVLALVATIV